MRIQLTDLETPVLLVPAPTGIVYCNQVDGVACGQRELEGFLIPLPANPAEIFAPAWREQNVNRRYRGDALAWGRAMDMLARSIELGEEVRDLRVEDNGENCEAWVHVTFDVPDYAEAQAYASAGRLAGVLTWQNCD